LGSLGRLLEGLEIIEKPLVFMMFSAMGRAGGSLPSLFSFSFDFRSHSRPFFRFPIVFTTVFGPWGSLWGRWGVPEGVPGGSGVVLGIPGGSLGVPEGFLGALRRSLEVPRGLLGGPLGCLEIIEKPLVFMVFSAMGRAGAPSGLPGGPSGRPWGCLGVLGGALGVLGRP